jgi:hypothetical protein
VTDVEDAVQVLAEAMHRVQCLPGSNPYHRFSDGHRGPEQRRAALILAELAKAGRRLVPVEESL